MGKKDIEHLGRKRLITIGTKLANNLGISALIGSELEFYLEGGEGEEEQKKLDNQLLALVMIKCDELKILLDGVKNDSGLRQYEIVLSPNRNPVYAAENLYIVRQEIVQLAEKLGLKACFDAKPYDDQPGSGLHIHISLHDRDGHNLYSKVGDDQETAALYFSMGGLCELMAESMVFFAPTKACYARYYYKVEANDNIQQANDNGDDSSSASEQCQSSNAPTHISWGANNRTTALRIPASTVDPDKRHIEHRVPSSQSDPFDVISAVIAGVYYGLSNRVMPPHDKLFGNAWDPQYGLEPLPHSLKEARKLSRGSKRLEDLFQD